MSRSRYLICYDIILVHENKIIGHSYIDLDSLTRASLDQAAFKIVDATVKDYPKSKVDSLIFRSVTKLDE